MMAKISKIMALTALTILAFGMTAIDNAVADEKNERGNYGDRQGCRIGRRKTQPRL